MIHIKVLTGFPNFISMVNEINYNLTNCIKNNIIQLDILNLRQPNSNQFDDNIFGGGNMALSLNAFKQFNISGPNIYYLNPDGIKLNQSMVQYMSQQQDITFISGRYEGIDQRIIEKYNICNISIGDYILSNGDIPIALIIDALARILYLSSNTLSNESFHNQLLDHDIYTRPKDNMIPKELLSGNHKLIQEWKLKNQLIKTLFYRDDLLQNKKFTSNEIKCIYNINVQIQNIIKKYNIKL